MVDSEANLREMLEDLFFVADLDGNVVGFASGSLGTSVPGERAVFPDGATFLDIQDLYVVPELRGGGVGTRLVRALVDAAAVRGADRLLVYSSNRDWEPTMRFYTRLGLGVWYVQYFK